MATVVDSFTETSDVALTSHTPDTGSTWVQLLISGARFINVYSATDEIGGSGATASEGQLCKSQPAPTSAEYDIDYTIKALDTGTATRPFGAHGRISDGSATNYYRSRHLPTGHASPDTELMMMVGGTKTSLGTADTGLAASDVLTLRMRDAAKEILKNGISILSSGDNTITAAGDAGFSIGFVKTGDTGNCASTYRIDDYTLTEVTTVTDDLATKYAQLGNTPLLLVSGG